MFFIGLILFILVLDLGIKDTIEETESELFPKELEGTGGKIILHKNHNAGFPFGLFQSKPNLVKVVPLVITSGVAGVFFWMSAKKGHNAEKLGLSLILGGALSNLYDRLIRHYVVDYFSIQWKSLKKVVFNLGDIFIFLGTGIMLIVDIVQMIKE